MPLDRERVTSKSWSGRDVQLRAVAAELSRVHAELSHSETGDREHPRPRNCVLNLIVAVGDEEREDSAEQVISAIATGHPLRAIVLHSNAEDGERLDAEIKAEAHHLVRGASVQLEQVTLDVHGLAGMHPASLVEPLLVPDVPTYLWWTGSPPLDEPALHDALNACDALIVDSAHFADRVRSFLDLAALAERIRDRVGFVDLQWARQKPWRETVAQLFAPGGRRPQLRGLHRVMLECVGQGAGNRVPAILFAGWLAAALGWRPTRRVSVTESAAEVLLEGGEERVVELICRAGEHPGLGDGELRALEIEGQTGRRRLTARMEIRPDRADHAHLELDINGAATIQQRLPMPREDEDKLLLHALSALRRDAVYLRSLDAAARLLEALR